MATADRLGQINYRMRVTLLDGRQLTGTLLAFDKVSRTLTLTLSTAMAERRMLIVL